MLYILETCIRLILACLLGGIVGYEREHRNRPAGFRTHILVCVGSALVMITSEYIFKKFSSLTDIDPTRLGAQVISGIGFLGAGTIVREKFNVRGLTTAASLWAVSCIGLAVGIGFYEGAVISTFFVYLTLMLLKKMEERIGERKYYKNVIVELKNTTEDGKNDIIIKITNIFSKYDVLIKNMEHFHSEEKNGDTIIKFMLKPPHSFSLEDIAIDLCNIEGVYRVYEE